MQELIALDLLANQLSQLAQQVAIVKWEAVRRQIVLLELIDSLTEVNLDTIAALALKLSTVLVKAKLLLTVTALRVTTALLARLLLLKTQLYQATTLQLALTSKLNAQSATTIH
jgi:ribosome maturation factor RimP